MPYSNSIILRYTIIWRLLKNNKIKSRYIIILALRKNLKLKFDYYQSLDNRYILKHIHHSINLQKVLRFKA